MSTLITYTCSNDHLLCPYLEEGALSEGEKEKGQVPIRHVALLLAYTVRTSFDACLLATI